MSASTRQNAARPPAQHDGADAPDERHRHAAAEVREPMRREMA